MHSSQDADYDVVVAGAGPVGLTLAIDLGQRGTKVLVAERAATPAPWPKMDRTNARSMELFRRLGIAERIRALGYPPEIPMDVFLMRRLSEPPVAVLQFPSVAQWRKTIARCHDGSVPLEPYQLVSQNRVEPLLKAVAEETPNVDVRYDCELVGFDQSSDGVELQFRSQAGQPASLRSRYLVGCDGGTSFTRKHLGIKLEGQGNLHEARQVIFYSDDLFERIPYGKGRHYSFITPLGATMVAQGDRKEFTLHTNMPADTDFVSFIRALVGFECDIRILHILSWRHQLLLAERYRDRHVLLAGDAAHLVIPTGGLGMNTGIGDAVDLGWKLAAVARGHAGDALLDSYAEERRPVAAYNIEASGWAAAGVPIWHQLISPTAFEDTEDGDDLRHAIAKSFRANHGRMHIMRGAEMNYTYAGSSLVAEEDDNPADWDRLTYLPHTRPGVRLPHMWTRSGEALQDLAGRWFTLVCLDPDCDTGPLARAFDAVGMPLEVLTLDEPHMIGVYEKPLLLLRPDLHVAWRGDALPADVVSLASRVTGRMAETSVDG